MTNEFLFSFQFLCFVCIWGTDDYIGIGVILFLMVKGFQKRFTFKKLELKVNFSALVEIQELIEEVEANIDLLLLYRPNGFVK